VISAALTEAQITLSSFSAERLRDSRVLALAQKTVFRAEPRFAANAAGGELCIVLKDGRQLRHAIDNALGDPQRPLSDLVLHAKFMDCASQAATKIDAAAAQRMADRILALEQEPDAGLILSARAAYA
jgi:2-methylcitrate dehydratase PrpD